MYIYSNQKIFHPGKLLGIALFILILLSLIVLPHPAQAEPPIVAVASNLNIPITEIANQFSEETGETVRLSFGSSGNLSRQIVQGAPYDIFISASSDYLNFLTEQNIPIKKQIGYVEGNIGYFVPSGSIFMELKTADEISNTINFGHQVRIALANPEHAPYGKVAIEALRNGGAWAMNDNNLIYAESVAQIVPYIQTGNIDLAIIPESFVLQNALGYSGKFILISQSWHNPITQYLAILDDSTPATISFTNYLLSESAISILKKYGYQRTGEN